MVLLSPTRTSEERLCLGEVALQEITLGRVKNRVFESLDHGPTKLDLGRINKHRTVVVDQVLINSVFPRMIFSNPQNVPIWAFADIRNEAMRRLGYAG